MVLSFLLIHLFKNLQWLLPDFHIKINFCFIADLGIPAPTSEIMNSDSYSLTTLLAHPILTQVKSPLLFLVLLKVSGWFTVYLT